MQLVPAGEPLPFCFTDAPEPVPPVLCMGGASEGLLWSLLSVAHITHTYQKWNEGERATCTVRKT